MSEATIITLNNGKKYEILMESELEDKKYYLTVELNEENEDTENYLFFEVAMRDGQENLRLIKDQAKLEELVVLFSVNYSKLADTLGGTN